MKRIYHALLVIVIAGISFKCQKELSSDHSPLITSNNQSSPVTVTLQGNVIDENDLPAAGVKISAGSKTTTTNSNGYFRIVEASLDKNASVTTAEQPGYFKAYRSFRATTGVNQLVIKLVKKTLAGTVNAITGGEAALSNGAKVSLPANGVMKASGGAYTGSVQVYAAYIDPTSQDIGKTVPGSFMADDKDKNRVVLSSYGMLAVELESAAGEKLQIQTGSAATLTMPIPSSTISSAPASISLWYTDEQTGVWKEQGTAKKTGSSYTGDVKHFSYWNCDLGIPAISFSAIFKTSGHACLTNISVRLKTLIGDNWLTAYGYTDSLGQTSGLVPSNRNLVLEVLDECANVVYSENVGPFSENTDLGTIVIPNSVTSLVTIKGKLLSCSNTPVSNGYALLNWRNFFSYIKSDAKGEFSTNIITCSSGPQTIEILGIDAATQQQGALQTILLTPPITDAGNINACGISTTEFINYTLDGIDHTISNSDSIYASGSPGAVMNTFDTYIQGYDLKDKEILNFGFTGSAIAGTHPLNFLIVENYNRLSKPFNVAITTFPQHSGEFYEGNFSGSFIDSSAASVIHNINCSFRVRKY
ncbi:MAG: carboxypeptidase-like regulatory domain-containing protein [Ferruginibacter sp.]